MTPLEKDAVLYAKTGKLEKLRACLDGGVSPSAADDSRVSLLVHAASRGHLAVVEELLRRGADANFISGWNDGTALYHAKLAGHTAVAQLLQRHTSVPARVSDNPHSPGVQRVPCLVPPGYDIDAILGVDLLSIEGSFAAVAKIYEALEALPPGVHHFRPDSALFPIEVAVRDLCRFDVSMGNGFACSLGYSGGIQIFYRALRAVRMIGHQKARALLEAVRDVLVANGAREPSFFPDDLYERCDVDWDVELEDLPGFDKQVEAASRGLDDQWLDISHCYGNRYARVSVEDPSLQYGVCEFLTANKGLLLNRRPANFQKGKEG